MNKEAWAVEGFCLWNFEGDYSFWRSLHLICPPQTWWFLALVPQSHKPTHQRSWLNQLDLEYVVSQHNVEMCCFSDPLVCTWRMQFQKTKSLEHSCINSSGQMSLMFVSYLLLCSSTNRWHLYLSTSSAKQINKRKKKKRAICTSKQETTVLLSIL